MPSPKRVTLRMIAEKAGVHYSTVSLALNNHPGLPAQTRERIGKLAEEMGYRPDPMLSGLAAYRTGRRGAGEAGVIAWVDFWQKPGSSRDRFPGVWAGACRRARELGWKLDEIAAGHAGLSSRETGRVLRARGVAGVLVAPQAMEELTMAMEWDRFSAVTMAHTLASPRLHRAGPHQFLNMQALMNALFALGYRRPGLFLGRPSHGGTAHHWRGGFLAAQAGLPPEDRLPGLEADFKEPDRFLKWFEDERPDVIVTVWYAEVIAALQKAGLRVPADVGVATPAIKAEAWRPRDEVRDPAPGTPPEISGMDEDFEAIGAALVDSVVAMMHRHEKGVPSSPTHLMIEGFLRPGGTVSARGPA